MATPNRMAISSLLNAADDEMLEEDKDTTTTAPDETAPRVLPAQSTSYPPPAQLPEGQPTASLPGQLKGKGKRQASNSPHPDSPSIALRRKRTKPNLTISPEAANSKFSPGQPSAKATPLKSVENVTASPNTSFGLGIGGLASGTSSYLDAPAAGTTSAASPTKDRGPMTSLASSFGQLFQDAEAVKDEAKASEYKGKHDNKMGGVVNAKSENATTADAKMGGMDEQEPEDSIMASIEAEEPEDPPEDVDIGSPTPPSSPVVAAQRQRPPQKQMQKQRYRFSMGEAIMSQNDILLLMCNFLGLKDFVNLYCVSKKFYVLVNSHYTTHVKQLARNHAPLASTIFPYQMYKRACIQDPMLRTRPAQPGEASSSSSSRNPDAATTTQSAEAIRTVPGLKWVQMCAYREAIVHDILLLLALEGHRFPATIPAAILRIWQLLDQPFNGPRLATVHSRALWPNRDVFLGLMFLVKLDMRFADPVLGGGECVLRRLLLGQKSLVVLWEALRGLNARSPAEVLSLAVEWDGVVPPGPDDRDGVTVLREGDTLFGVPVERVGSLSREGWTQGGEYLLRPDQLLLRESVRREMNIHRCFLDYMLWGYIDWVWLTDIPLPDLEALTLEDERKRRRYAGEQKNGDEEEGERKVSSGSFKEMSRASGAE